MIVDWFTGLSPITQAFLATLFTWFLTALGAATVFLFRKIDKKVLDGMLGFAAGVMIAASYWSLLAPAIEMAENSGQLPWVPAVVGFLAGGLFLSVVDRFVHKLHIKIPPEALAHGGTRQSWHRSILLIFAITLHNIPEGLAVGVAFGALAHGLPSASLTGAVVLAIGIGIQNFPEGIAVSVPLRREGLSRLKSFWYGQLSGLVEPVAGVLGAVSVIVMQSLLPYALSFAAGAMIYVVVKELIPESQQEKTNQEIATLGAMLGFAVMMSLDVALG
jgi:ZIP family zinc transporter